MKNFLILIALLFSVQGQAHGVCKIQLQPAGIHVKYCPVGTLVNANATHIRHVGNSIYVQDQIRCVRPVLVCGKDQEVLDTQEDFEDN